MHRAQLMTDLSATWVPSAPILFRARQGAVQEVNDLIEIFITNTPGSIHHKHQSALAALHTGDQE